MQKPLDNTKLNACLVAPISVGRCGPTPHVLDGAGRRDLLVNGMAAFTPADPAEGINGECYGQRQKTGYATGWDNRCNGVRAGWEQDSR